MDFDYVSWAAETRELVRKYGVVTPVMDNLLNLMLLYANSGRTGDAERVRQIVEKQLRPIYAAKINKVPSMPVPTQSEGEIILGDIFQGDRIFDEFKIPLRDFNRHITVFASAGHGKTTLLINLLHQLHEHDINFLAFDFKQDLRHLKHLPIICLRWNWLRINPFKPPPGVDELQWLSLVCNLFAHVYGWFHASKNYLFEFVNEQYQKYRENGYVTLQKVMEAIENSQDKEFERQRMKTVVLNRISTLLVVCNEVLDCEEGFPIHELLNYPVVIEMDDCESDEANFLVALFLIYIFEYRKAQQHRGSLKHVIVFDEAHRIFYRQSEYRETEVELGSSTVNQIPRIIRDYNEGLIFATQEPSQINNSVMANTDLKLVGYLGNGNDIEAIRKAFQLNDEDAQIIKRLKIGQFMAQKSGINEGDPFLLQGYDYPIQKTVSNDELRERMKDFIAKIQSEPKKTGGTMADYIKLPSVSEKAAKILEHVAKKPLRNVSQRYKELGIHPLEGKNAVKELCDKKLLIIRPIQLSAGRPSLYLEPTEMGKAWLAKNKIDMSAWTDYVGHVGIEHRVYQWLIANGLKKLGYTVQKEFNITMRDMKDFSIRTKRFDVFAQRGENEKLGIEICISPKMNFFEVIEAAEQLTEILFICRDINVVQLMQKEMASLGVNNSKFKFVIAHRYLSELYSYLSKSENNENNPSNTLSSENNSPSPENNSTE